MRTFLLLLLIPLACGFSDVASTPEAPLPPIPVVNPDYLVLRAVSRIQIAGTHAAVLQDQSLYFDPQKKLLDLTDFDLRSATIEHSAGTAPEYAVVIRTTALGNQVLRDWTAVNVGNQLGVFLDGRLVAAPVITSPIEWVIAVDTDVTKEDAEAIVAKIKRGGV